MIIWNKNKEVDIYFDDLWMFMTLIDSTCPTLIGQYVDGNYTETLVYEVNAPKLNINGFVFVLFPALVAKKLSI